jgi:diguanylate cyclase (GGDEF)-like protein
MGVWGNIRSFIESLIPEEERYTSEPLYRTSFLSVSLLFSLSLIGSAASFLYSVIDILEGDYVVSFLEAVVGTVLLLNPFVARKYRNFNVMAMVSVSLFGLVLLASVFDELPEDQSSLLWLLVIPPVVFLAFGRRAVYLIFVLSRSNLPLGMLLDAYLSFGVISVVLYFYAWMSERYREVWSNLARTDSLTGILNRPAFEEVLVREMVRAKRFNEPVSLILFDIDNFKKINDMYGHLFGDKILRRITEAVKENIRSVDVFARWGGEEFVILLPKTRLDETRTVAEKLRKKVHSVGMGSKVGVTASFGITEMLDGDDPFRLILKADKALYKAKTNGKNRVEAFLDTA